MACVIRSRPWTRRSPFHAALPETLTETLPYMALAVAEAASTGTLRPERAAVLMICAARALAAADPGWVAYRDFCATATRPGTDPVELAEAAAALRTALGEED